MLPARLAPLLFSLILSGTMSCLVTAVATVRALGPMPGFASVWMETWLTAWPVAFAAAFTLAPLVRRLVARLVRPADPA